MLKRIKDYIPEFKDFYYINEFGDIYKEIFLKKGSNGSYDAKVQREGKTLHLGRDIQEFLREEFNIHLCSKYGSRKASYYKRGDYYVINSKIEVLYKDKKFYVNLTDRVQSDGYKWTHSGKKHYPVHQVVYRCFIGDITKGNIIHHINRDTTFNWYKNLIQLTREEHINEHREELNILKVQRLSKPSTFSTEVE